MLHFSDMSAYADREIPVIERGEGCHVYDRAGRRYIDGLSGLYCLNLGHSHGDEIGRAALDQMRRLPFTSNWTVAHPPSIDLAARVAELAPRGLDRVFFTSGGSEAVESAWKLAPQWHAANGQPQRRKAIARTRRLPRGHPGRALPDRNPDVPDCVRAPRHLHPPRLEHQSLSPPAGRRRGGVLCLAPRRDRGYDRLRGRGNDPRCSSPSPCRTPAGA